MKRLLFLFADSHVDSCGLPVVAMERSRRDGGLPAVAVSEADAKTGRRT